MHWKEAVRKFTDVQAKKMLVLRQQQVPLFYLIQSLVLVNALQKIFQKKLQKNFFLVLILFCYVHFDRILLGVYEMCAFFTPTPVISTCCRP